MATSIATGAGIATQFSSRTASSIYIDAAGAASILAACQHPAASEALLSSYPHPDSIVQHLISDLRAAVEAFKTDGGSSKSTAALVKSFKGAQCALDHAAPPPGAPVFLNGDRVIMHDLKQRADLNGCVAVVKNAAEFFECNGRLEVSAGAVGKRELLKLKPSNLRLEWHVAAEVHATCVASVVTVSSLGSELRGRTCRVLSYDDATQSVALHVEGQEPGAAGPADSVRVPVSDVVPASYSDIAKELHGCAMKAIMRSWTDRHTPCVSAACLAVQSCAAFYIRSSLDDEAARVCVTFLKLLYSGGRKESKDTLRDAELRMVWVGSFIMVCSNVLYCNFFHSCCYAAAITVLQQCKLIIDQTEGILNENMAAIHHNIAQCHERLDQYDDAESEYNNALRIGLLLEPCGEAVAQVCCGLGALHDKQNRLNDAADAYEQALVRYKQLRGWESPGVAQVLSCSARVFERQDKLDEAKTAYEEALRIKVLLIGYESLDVAEILNNVAGLYQKLHRLDDAASSLLEALRIRKSQLGNENLPVADTLSDLAQVRELQSQLEEAEALHTEALRIRTLKLGAESFKVSRSMHDIAVLHRRRGMLEQAEAMFNEALRIQKLKLGPDSIHVAATLRSLASLHELQASGTSECASVRFETCECDRARLAESQTLLLEALRITNLVLGCEASESTALLQVIGELAERHGHMDQAEFFFQHALRLQEEKHGEGDIASATRTKILELQPPPLSDI